jgi:epoxyqueuosine reductase
MEEEIKKILNNLNIAEFGFCKIKYYKNLENILNSQMKQNKNTKFQVGNIEDKVFKTDYFKDYKSALVILVPYTSGKNEKKNITENDFYLSTCSWDIDYHTVINEILTKVKHLLENKGYKAKIFVDNNILDERYMAYEAGLGYYGKNNLLFNDKYGSYFFIGILLTNASFKYKRKLDKKCLECNLCVNSCPTGALSKDMILDGNKCLSYLNQKKNISEKEEKYFNNCIYGCDICQDVCPLNKYDYKEIFNFTGKEIVKLEDKNKFIKMFDNNFKNSSCYWRKKELFERNINLYVKNKKKKKSKVEN